MRTDVFERATSLKQSKEPLEQILAMLLLKLTTHYACRRADSASFSKRLAVYSAKRN